MIKSESKVEKTELKVFQPQMHRFNYSNGIYKISQIIESIHGFKQCNYRNVTEFLKSEAVLKPRTENSSFRISNLYIQIEQILQGMKVRISARHCLEFIFPRKIFYLFFRFIRY